MSDREADAVPSMVREEVVPFLRVTNARAAARWYGRLGFHQEWEHQFGPDFPVLVAMSLHGRSGATVFLSEHAGDATPNTLIYMYVADVDAIAREFGAEVTDSGWAREVHLTDPDGNRLRLGTPTPA